MTTTNHCEAAAATALFSSSDCFTSSSSACSGRGRCVISPVSGRTDLCLCDAGWSGAHDMFDLRVEKLMVENGSSSTYLALDCTNSTTLNTLACTCFFVVCWILNLVFAVRLFQRLRRKRVPLSNAYRSFSFKSFVAGLLDIAVVSCMAHLKLFYPDESVVGTDTAITLLFVSSISIKLSENICIGYEELAQFRGISPVNLERTYALVSLAQVAAQVALNMLTVGMLFLDRSEGAFENGQCWLVVTRAVGGIVYTKFMAKSRQVVLSEVQAVIEFAQRLEDDDNNGVDGKDFARVLRKFERHNQLQSSVAMKFGLVYAMTALPPLWPYSIYVFLLVTTTWRVVAHPARLLSVGGGGGTARPLVATETPESPPPLTVRFRHIKGSVLSRSDERESDANDGGNTTTNNNNAALHSSTVASAQTDTGASGGVQSALFGMMM